MSIESIAAMAIDSPVSSGDPRDRWHRHEMSLGAMWLLLALGLRWIAADHDLSFSHAIVQPVVVAGGVWWQRLDRSQ